MQQRLFICLSLALVVLFAACQGPPPTQIILVVTATPGENTSETVETSETAEAEAATEETTLPPTQEVTPQPSPTVNTNPTPTITQIQVAEQVFEHGRMFWLQPTEQIWVMAITGEGKGTWNVYTDDFADGDLEFDPDMTVPQGFEQPKRGFGKLWRDNPDIREALGWAITPEFGYVTRYEYHPGGDGTLPGYHVLFSLYNEGFRFNEADQTWQLN
jgi:hypothetical protein